jgi:diguanylate cyclase (GGDEF)-like protein
MSNQDAGGTLGGADHDEHEPSPVYLRALLSDTGDLTAVLDPDGKCTYLNRAGRRLLAVSPEVSVRSLSLFDLVSEANQALLHDEVIPALDSAMFWSGQLILATMTGTEVPTRTTIRVHPAGGRLTWVARDVTTEKVIADHLSFKAFYDPLTGLRHRTLFLDKLDLSLRRVDDEAVPVAVLFVSLDRFKEKNDRFGRDVGDELLKAVARRLPITLEEDDTVARWGGDEFVVLREGVLDDDEALVMAGRITKAFEDPFLVNGLELFLTASVGIATAGPGEMSTDELLRHADAAGQMAKQRGGGVAHIYDEEMQARAQRRAEVEDALRGAADRGELVLYYQPEVLLRTNEIVAVEALIRWHHPDWGLVSPAEFVPVAEAGSLILEIGQFVLQEAMAQCARWRAQFGDRAPSVAINLSARQFGQDDFVEAVASTLASTGADPEAICLEITESILMDDVELTVATLRRLKGLGIRLAVDDFGTGYSSLSYLRRFPVDILKVDQSFVSGLGHDPEDSAIVQAVVHMGRALNLTTVAEGVETAHHLIELRELDCDIAQGYHFARPHPAEAITRLLAAGSDWLNEVV